MNIESLLSKMNLFDDLVIHSGFKRDIVDYIEAIEQPQNRNLVFMRDLSSKVEKSLMEINNNSLHTELDILLKESNPFTSLNTLDEINTLDKDKEIDANQYFKTFHGILHQLNQKITENEKEIDEVREVFEKYIPDDEVLENDKSHGLVSLIFKDLQSTKSLKEFAKALHRWNRTLITYHTLLKSDSPEEITLVEIQNGSIDVIFNIDFDVAINLTELFHTGLKVYGAYLLYKSKTAREIISSYMGNAKLIKSEESREILMLDNVKDSIKRKALEQHKSKLKKDKNIDKNSIDIKAGAVSAVITDHIIKGNEVKLLTPPKSDEETEEKDISQKVREETAIVRERFKTLKPEDKQLLLEKYTLKEDGEGVNNQNKSKSSNAKND